ncbi:MAG: hypothetical protein KBC38_03240 [Candidatus Pacebacteria bacterium]|nr:hypothetical protein [Candidatus Paceibacterota bacterium]MBP9840574.1 hypothetical protein [Candidatus Paceibacterota bacterium]
MAKAKPESVIPTTSLLAKIIDQVNTNPFGDVRAPSEMIPSGVESIGVAPDYIRRLVTIEVDLQFVHDKVAAELKELSGRLEAAVGIKKGPMDLAGYVRSVLESDLTVEDLDNKLELERQHWIIHARMKMLRELIKAELIFAFPTAVDDFGKPRTLTVYSNWSVAPVKGRLESLLEGLTEAAMNASRSGNGSGRPVPEFDDTDEVSAMFDGLFGSSPGLGDILRQAGEGARFGE